MVVLVAQPCPTLCDPMDCSPPGSSVHGILQARILERVAIPFCREYWSGLPYPPPGDLPNPRIEPTSLISPALSDKALYHCTTWEAPIIVDAYIFKKSSKCK